MDRKGKVGYAICIGFKKKKKECVLHICRVNSAFIVYEQLSRKKKGDFSSIKDLVYPREFVDIYLAKMQKFTIPFSGMTECTLVSLWLRYQIMSSNSFQPPLG